MRRMLAMLWIALVGCEPASSVPHAKRLTPAATATTTESNPRYFASSAEACGQSLLSIAAREEGPFELVVPSGPAQPHNALKYHAAINGKWIVTGHRTGRIVDDHHCGAYPEFQVTGFVPWGPVRRLVSIHGLEGELQHYTEPLPGDRYVASDYAGGPDEPSLDTDSCVENFAECSLPRVKQQNADGGMYCCRLLETRKN